MRGLKKATGHIKIIKGAGEIGILEDHVRCGQACSMKAHSHSIAIEMEELASNSAAWSHGPAVLMRLEDAWALPCSVQNILHSFSVPIHITIVP